VAGVGPSGGCQRADEAHRQAVAVDQAGQRAGAARRQARPHLGRDEDFNDFGIRITSKASVSFFVLRRIKGMAEPINIVLGSYPDMTLAAARKEATKQLALFKEGRDPREVAKEERAAKAKEKKAEAARQANTFGEIAETFIGRYVVPRMRTAPAVALLVRRVFVSRWDTKPITDIGRADIIEMLEEIGEHSPSSAQQALTYVRFSNRPFGVKHLLPD
jgi:hypothetical protein